MPSSPAIEFIARGLLIEHGRVLVCRNLRHGYCFLPGGHVEFGEPARTALKREFVEECGIEVEVGDCLLAEEHLFGTRAKEHHELNLVFHVERASRGVIESREPKIGFEWIAITDLAGIQFLPNQVREWICRGPLEARPTPTAEWMSTDSRPV